MQPHEIIAQANTIIHSADGMARQLLETAMSAVQTAASTARLSALMYDGGLSV